MKVTDIPLKAQVQCTNALAGESVAVIVDPKTLQVTHFSVREHAGTQRLVPVDHVESVSLDLIRLDCTTAELAKMEPFVVTEYHHIEVPRVSRVGTSSSTYVGTVKETREMVPWAEVAVHPGDAVHASDGRVGRLGRLVADEDGQITHLSIEEGHLWGKVEVLVPASMVKEVRDRAIHLTIDKATLAATLAIPVKAHYGVSELELLAYVLDQAERGEQALGTLQVLAKGESVTLLSAALMIKDAEGQTSLREMGDVDARHGALFGAVTGGLVGLLGGPVGVIVGAAAGAATARAVAKRVDLGFPDEFLQRARERLQPGTAAVIALVERQGADVVARALAQYEGQALRFPLTDDHLVRLAWEAESDEA